MPVPVAGGLPVRDDVSVLPTDRVRLPVTVRLGVPVPVGGGDAVPVPLPLRLAVGAALLLALGGRLADDDPVAPMLADDVGDWLPLGVMDDVSVAGGLADAVTLPLGVVLTVDVGLFRYVADGDGVAEIQFQLSVTFVGVAVLVLYMATAT